MIMISKKERAKIKDSIYFKNLKHQVFNDLGNYFFDTTLTEQTV